MPYPATLDDDSTLRVAADLARTKTTDDILVGDDEISVESTADFPSAGDLRINLDNDTSLEFVTYTSKTATKFLGVVRGVDVRYPAIQHTAPVSIGLAVMAKHHNNLKEAMKNVQGTLGTDPQGAHTTVKARIIAVEAAATAAQADIDAHEAAADPHTQYVEESREGAANGIATLDSAGKVPTSQLPSSVMEYKGTWNASTNTPVLADGSGNAGDLYRVSVAGTQNLGSGPINFDVGDYVIYNGAVWERSDSTDAVASVDGRTGAVILSDLYDAFGAASSHAALTTAHGTTSQVVGKDDVQILTNKTIDAPTNTVRANKLATTGDAVDVAAAAPPTAGQILTATDATHATWQNPIPVSMQLDHNISNAYVNNQTAYITISGVASTSVDTALAAMPPLPTGTKLLRIVVYFTGGSGLRATNPFASGESVTLTLVKATLSGQSFIDGGLVAAMGTVGFGDAFPKTLTVTPSTPIDVGGMRLLVKEVSSALASSRTVNRGLLIFLIPPTT